MVRPSARGALRLISTWSPLHRQVSRVGAREDLASVCADDPIGVVEVGPIAHRTTDGDRHMVVVDRRNPISRRQSDELIGLDGEEDICTAEQRVGPSLGKAREGLLEVRTSRIATPKSSQSALAPPGPLPSLPGWRQWTAPGPSRHRPARRHAGGALPRLRSYQEGRPDASANPVPCHGDRRGRRQRCPTHAHRSDLR
jgi:hypothetical protein